MIFRPVLAAGLLLALAPHALAARLQPQTIRAFDAYVEKVEAEMMAEIQAPGPSFIWLADDPAAMARLAGGAVLVQQRKEGTDVPDGMLHDWTGTMLIRDRTVEQVVTLLTDYKRHEEVYPEVQESRLVEQGPDSARTFLQLRRKKIVTVVYNTEYDVRYFKPSPERWASISRSTRIAQLDDPDKPRGKEHPVGDDSGYLWRLYAYWRVEEHEDGVLVSCRAISLSRGIPFGLGWLIKPFVTSVPRESLEATLDATRRAVREKPSAARSSD